jgi:hypothetical protein
MPRLAETDGHHGPYGYRRGGTEGRRHWRRRLAYGHHIDSESAMEQRDDIGAAQRLLNEAAGVGGFDGRTYDRRQVRSEYGI